MYWICTCIFTGVLLSIGWRIGGLIFRLIEDLINETPYGIRKIKRYRKYRNKRVSYTDRNTSKRGA